MNQSKWAQQMTYFVDKNSERTRFKRVNGTVRGREGKEEVTGIKVQQTAQGRLSLLGDARSQLGNLRLGLMHCYC